MQFVWLYMGGNYHYSGLCDISAIRVGAGIMNHYRGS